MDDAGWAAAAAGCDTVLHVASPVHTQNPADADAVVTPAREGTVRVLRAARAAGVRRVVLTSAFHAVGWGHPRRTSPFTEADWTVLDGPGVDAYARSKTLAERDAWQLAGESGPELVTLCPVAVVGPVLGPRLSGANQLLQRILDRAMPALPRLFVPFVDVRDVAVAHARAITTPDAAGQRFLLAALRHRELAPVVGDLGYAKQVDDSAARRVPGWQPRPASEAVVAAGASLLEHGLVRGGLVRGGLVRGLSGRERR